MPTSKATRQGASNLRLKASGVVRMRASSRTAAVLSSRQSWLYLSHRSRPTVRRSCCFTAVRPLFMTGPPFFTPQGCVLDWDTLSEPVEPTGRSHTICATLRRHGRGRDQAPRAAGRRLDPGQGDAAGRTAAEVETPSRRRDVVTQLQLWPIESASAVPVAPVASAAPASATARRPTRRLSCVYVSRSWPRAACATAASTDSKGSGDSPEDTETQALQPLPR